MNKIAFSAHTIGKRTGPHEDACFGDPHTNIYIVADGLGGDRHGNLASRMATELISRAIHGSSIHTESTWLFPKKKGLSLEENFIRMAFLHANTKIISRAQHESKFGWMGCSAIALLAIPEEPALVIAGVGNCRAYRFRKGTLTQLTLDASLAQYKKWLPHRPSQNIPLNFLGKSPTLELDQCVKITPKTGDLYLLVSSGITHALTPDQICAEVIKKASNINELSSSLPELAHQQAPIQDVSVMVLSFGHTR